MRYCLLAALLFITSPSNAADPRRVISEPRAVLDAIGRVNVAGFKRKSLCTGTLIAADKVVTAAHCVFNKRTSQPHRVQKIHFVAGKWRDRHKAHGRVASIRFLNGYDTNPRIENDVAILTLTEPVAVTPLPVRQGGRATRDLAHILYGRDRPHLPVVDDTCAQTSETNVPHVWLTSCVTIQGGSGGPVFEYGEEGAIWTVSAIMVALVRGGGSLAIASERWQHLLAE